MKNPLLCTIGLLERSVQRPGCSTSTNTSFVFWFLMLFSVILVILSKKKTEEKENTSSTNILFNTPNVAYKILHGRPSPTSPFSSSHAPFCSRTPSPFLELFWGFWKIFFPLSRRFSPLHFLLPVVN